MGFIDRIGDILGSNMVRCYEEEGERPCGGTAYSGYAHRQD